MSTPISIVGTVATAPRLLRTASGVPLCAFRVASDERRFDREQQRWVDGETNWFSVTAFRSLAEHAHESFSRGDRVLVSGKLRVRRWEQNEKAGLSVEIDADALGHELRWGVSRFTKRDTGGGTGGGGGADGDAVTRPGAPGPDSESGSEFGGAPDSSAQPPSPGSNPGAPAPAGDAAPSGPGPAGVEAHFEGRSADGFLPAVA